MHSYPDAVADAAAVQRLLLEAYERYGDAEVLTPLARLEAEVRDVAPLVLDALGGLSDAHGANRVLRERALLLERLLGSDFDAASRLGDDYAAAFAYALGHAKRRDGIPHVVRILDEAFAAHEQAAQALREYFADLGSAASASRTLSREVYDEAYDAKRDAEERLRLGVWALGRLQAKGDLLRWARRCHIAWLEELEARASVE